MRQDQGWAYTGFSLAGVGIGLLLALLFLKPGPSEVKASVEPVSPAPTYGILPKEVPPKPPVKPPKPVVQSKPCVYRTAIYLVKNGKRVGELSPPLTFDVSDIKIVDSKGQQLDGDLSIETVH